MKENNSFISFDCNDSGLLFDEETHTEYPIKYYNVIKGKGISYKNNCSYYFYVYEGVIYVSFKSNPPVTLERGMYMSTSEKFTVQGEGSAVIIEVYHNKGVYPETKYSAVTIFGGKVESVGRLKYIDGCTDSLLIPPVKMGDPCLNHLHFPKGIDQTPHTHPSHRIGIVSNGYGECITPFGNLPLEKNMIFVIKEWDGKTFAKGLNGAMYPTGTHSFKTTDSEMDVIAFHPDSDFGATDVDHPMINRTIVDGVSANKIHDIRTK